MAQTPEEVAARQAIEAQHLARDDRLLASQRAAVDSAKAQLAVQQSAVNWLSLVRLSALRCKSARGPVES